MKIDWAPVNVPLDRRLQTLAVALELFIILCGQMTCAAIIILLLIYGHVYIQLLTVSYLTFCYFDRDTAHMGGRGAGLPWFRRLGYLKHLTEYFPVDLVKTVDLPADRNYLLAVFPHGLLSFGAVANFTTDHSKWPQLFPGIRAKLMTLSAHFYIPIFRELLLAWGMAAASAESIEAQLNCSNDPKAKENRADGFTANATVVVIGGAQEAFYAQPKNYTVVLKNRKGFVRLAIQSGMPIVPVVSFNEVEIYDQVWAAPGSRMRRLQEWAKLKTGMSPIVAIGRGFFQYSFGILPQRKAITTVVGAPVEVPHIAAPSKEDIAEVHARFCEALVELFETHKAKYIEGHEDVQLVIE